MTPTQRTLYWLAMFVAAALAFTGVVVAVAGYLSTAGPGGVVRDYFAALSRGDARTALSYGRLPDGPRDLLTSPVLQAQLDEGRISQVSVIAVDRAGDTASVSIHYQVTGPTTGMTVVDDRVPVVKDGRSWRLAEAAVPVDLTPNTAQRRATVAGAAVPAGRPLVFPGAAPVSFDTPALALADPGRIVHFAGSAPADLTVAVSSQGQQQAVSAVAAALRGCLAAAKPASLCPLPAGGRAVPGSVHATIDGSAAGAGLTASVAAGDPNGRIEVVGEVPVTGSYQELSFENQAVTRAMVHHALPVRAHVLATAPAHVIWEVL